MDSGSPKIYTRTGDKGKTSLIGGTRVSKAHARLDAYGTVDELNSWLGLMLHDMKAELTVVATITQSKKTDELSQDITDIQSDLFDLGSHLATENPATRAQLPALPVERIAYLEKRMDEFSGELKPLRNFILPGGSRAAADAHLARTVCRRAERLCVALNETDVASEEPTVEPQLIQYLNRLSDYLFVFARYLNHLMAIDEPIWAAGRKG